MRGRSEGAWSPVYRQKVLVSHIPVVYSGIVMPGSVKLSATATVANIWDSIGFLSLRNITALDNSPILFLYHQIYKSVETLLHIG